MKSATVWNGTDCINDVVGVGNNGVVKSVLDVGVFDLERIMFEQTPPTGGGTTKCTWST